MKTEHPITPPPELVQQWFLRAKAMPVDQWVTDVATQAARWGADQKLEACLERILDVTLADQLRSARRPKPPSLKEQALTQLDSLHADLKTHGLGTNTDTIRRALEALPMSETKVVELPKPDYALIYAKLARHVAAADALLNHCNDSEARKEMEEAMQAIATFERTFATPAFVIAVEAPPNV